MAINRADIQAKTFLLPEQQQVAAPRTGGGAGAAPTYDSKYFGIPDAAEGLQWTDNVSELSNQYYQKLTSLDQFAKSMWLNNKIDVTKPDRSNPQAFLASQAYQKELGNIMSLADELKESQKGLTKADEGQMAGTYQVNPEMFQQGRTFASGNPYQQGEFTGITEPYQEAVKQFSGPRETQGIISGQQAEFDNRMAAMEAQAQQLAQTNPDQAKNIMDQINRARMAQRMYVNPPAEKQDYGPGGPKAYVNDFITRVVNHKRGIGQFAKSDYTEGGETWLESNDFRDTNLGTRVVLDANGKEVQADLVIDKTVKNPKTGRQKVVFKNSSVPPIDITDMPANQLIELMTANNARYPSLSDIQQFIQATPGAADSRGIINDNRFIAPKEKEKATEQDIKYQEETSGYEADLQNLLSEIKQIKPSSPGVLGSRFWGFAEGREVISPKLQIPLMVRKNDNGTFAIVNIAEADPSYNALTTKQKQQFQSIKEADLPKLLRGRYGVTCSSWLPGVSCGGCCRSLLLWPSLP